MLDEGKESSADIYLVPDLSLEPRFLVFLCKYEKRRKHSLTTRDFIKTTFSPPFEQIVGNGSSQNGSRRGSDLCFLFSNHIYLYKKENLTVAYVVLFIYTDKCY